MSWPLEMFQYEFVRRGVLVGVFVAIGCGPLGLLLVLRRHSLLGEGLGHFALGAVGLALFLGWLPLVVMLPLMILASVTVLEMPSRGAVRGDAAVGMVAAVGMAAGILLASVAGGFNVDLFSYLFGDLLAVTRQEVWLSGLLSALVVGVMGATWREYMAIAWDEVRAKTLGLNARRYQRLLAILTAVVVALGIRVAGTLLVSSLLIFPASTALRLRRGFRATLLLAAVVAVVGMLLGLILALAADLPVGATVVLGHAALFALTFLFGPRRIVASAS